MKTSIKALDTILEASQDLINEATARYKANLIAGNDKREQPLTPGLIDIYTEDYRFSTTIDLIKALYKYLKKDDQAGNFNANISSGVLEISATIIRDGQKYFLGTQMITAGGYNIQRAHYRYLVDTTLPKDESAEKVYQRLTKIQKLEIDLNHYINRYANAEAKLVELLTTPMNEVWEKRNRKELPAYFTPELVAGTKNMLIHFAESDIATSEKCIAKYQKKLAELV